MQILMRRLFLQDRQDSASSKEAQLLQLTDGMHQMQTAFNARLVMLQQQKSALLPSVQSLYQQLEVAGTVLGLRTDLRRPELIPAERINQPTHEQVSAMSLMYATQKRCV